MTIDRSLIAERKRKCFEDGNRMEGMKRFRGKPRKACCALVRGETERSRRNWNEKRPEIFDGFPRHDPDVQSDRKRGRNHQVRPRREYRASVPHRRRILQKSR